MTMKTMIMIIFAVFSSSLFARDNETVILNPPDTTRGLPVMKALALRASPTLFDTTSLNMQDLSDLLWAANGVNRKESAKRTAPSAQNAQDIDVYVFVPSAVYLYNAVKHVLELVVEGDYRKLVAGRQADVAKAPVICLLVSDISRFRFGEDSLRVSWAAMDAGIVSQNIALFCAANGLITRPRASMDQEKLRELLKLKYTQYIMMNNPVSYRKQ